jgi:hypothetical protein
MEKNRVCPKCGKESLEKTSIKSPKCTEFNGYCGECKIHIGLEGNKIFGKEEVGDINYTTYPFLKEFVCSCKAEKWFNKNKFKDKATGRYMKRGDAAYRYGKTFGWKDSDCSSEKFPAIGVVNYLC